MIDKKFWKTIADNWSKEEDGIIIPPPPPPPSLVPTTSADDDEIDKILSELGLDDL